MAADRFYIGNYDKNSGLRTDYKPYMIPDEAFAALENAYVFRGRVRKRFGSRWLGTSSLLSRFRVQIGTVTAGVISGNLRTLLSDATMPTAVGQSFSISTNSANYVFTVVNSNAGNQQMLRSDGSVATATFNLTNSDFNITSIAAPNNTPVYFYPGFPVMGLLTFENNSYQNSYTIGFDTRYAYVYSTGWDRLSGETNPGDAIWSGSDYQFFWGTSWSGANASDRIFFVTNFNKDEPNFMRYFDGTDWTTFEPAITSSINLISAQILLVFKNRLIALNTWEGADSASAVNYNNRCRYAVVGDPTGINSWRQDINKPSANSVDAATTESIISAEFIKDRLIVYFERSTWELVYTGNQAYPFTWQKINTEIGAESPFSTVPFDKVVLGISQVGVHACTGSNVERIDSSIPDEVFNIDTANNGVLRVYGIRDYYVEQTYWAFPDTTATPDAYYPNQVLVFNYKTGTWALNDDIITAFGYLQPTTGVLWSSDTVFWNSDTPWSSGAVQSLARQVIAGNQQGYTFYIDTDATTNALVFQITNIVGGTTTTVTSINHNLKIGEYIFINDAEWSDSGNHLNGTIFQVVLIIDANNFLIAPDSSVSATYIGGGVYGLVSQINIVTKQYNFYAKDNRNAYISKVDFMVDTTPAGQIQVNYFSSTSTDALLQESMSGGTIVGTGNLDTFAYSQQNKDFGLPVVVPLQYEQNASRVWHPVYFQAEGEVIQFQLTFDDSQMRDIGIAESDFQLHAMIITATPTSYRLQ